MIYELGQTPTPTNSEAVCWDLSGTPILGTTRQNLRKPWSRTADPTANFSTNLSQASTSASPVKGVNTTRAKYRDVLERKAAHRACL